MWGDNNMEHNTKNNEEKIRNKYDDVVLNTDGYKSQLHLTTKYTPKANHLLCTTINRKENKEKRKIYKESEKYVIIATKSRDINVNRNSSKIRLDGEHFSEKYKKKEEEFPTSSKLNEETMEYKSKLQHRKNEAQNKKESTLNVDIWDNYNITKELKQKKREIESVVKRYSKNKSNNNKTKREYDLLNCRLEINDKRTYLIDNNPDNNMMEQAREQQKNQSKSKNSKVLSNVDNNILHREIDIKNNSDGSKDKIDSILMNTINNVKMKHSFKIQSNSIESKSISISNV